MTEEEIEIALEVERRFQQMVATPVADSVWRGLLDDHRLAPFERAKTLCLIFYDAVAAIERSPFVIGDCRICGAGTVYLDEGLPPICQPCAKKLADEN